MGSKLYTTRDWAGKWICAEMTLEDRMAPIFKKDFTISGEIKDAKIFVSGLGYFELKINGNLPDDSVLNPANTHYCQTALYREFDAAAFLNNGENAITVELGCGFYNEPTDVWKWDTAPWRSVPKMILDLVITYADGRQETITSDESWLVTLDGPIVRNSIYNGEIFDARRCEFAWKNAIPAEAPKGELRCQDVQPIRRVAQFAPEAINRLADGTYIVTSPEMSAGWVKLRINAPRDTEVVITYSEALVEDGHVLRNGKNEGPNGGWWPNEYIQQDTYISDGNEAEYEPKFSYKGYKYIQIENYPGELTADDMVLYRVANDVDVISSFRCSNELVNKLHDIMRRTLHNNFQGKPTDTPIWEKNGWLGDLNVALASAFYNFDLRGFLNCFVHMMADCQSECGVVPIMVPAAKWGEDNCIVWNSVFVFAVEKLCDYYGETDFARKMYPDLKVYAKTNLDLLERRNWIWDGPDFSDWVSPSGDEFIAGDAGNSEGSALCSTAYAYAMLLAMEKIARMLNEEEDAKVYAAAAQKVYAAFNAKYYNAEKQIYTTGQWRQIGKRTEYRQTSNLVPLNFGLVPEDKKAGVVKNLMADFEAKGYHLDTGCVGTRAVLPVLFDEGYADAATTVLKQTTYPSWGYWIAKGATSTWEGWEPSARSQNHYFLGTCAEAMYSHILGIRDIRDGFSRFTVAPEVECELEFAEGSIQTVNGPVSCAWKKENGKTTVDIVVPEGATADIRLPGIETQVQGGKYQYIIG